MISALKKHVSWIFVVCTALGVLCRNDFYIGTVFHLLRVPVLLVLFMLLAWAMRRRQSPQTGGLVFACTLILVEWAWGVGAKVRPPPDIAKAAPLRTLSYNVYFRNAAREQTIAVIKRHPVDVAFFQEVTPRWSEALSRALAPSFPYSSLREHSGTHGLALFSRFPIQDVRLLTNDAGRAIAECATLLTHPRPTHVCNVHLASPAGPLSKPETALWGLHQNEFMRRQQWRDILEEMERRNREEPSNAQLIAGDFNTMEWEPLYAEMTRHFFDVCAQTDFWPSPTFPNLGPTRIPAFLRIDYVLARGHVTPQSCTRELNGASDHHALFVELS